jgi:hypothetical protein
MAISPTAKYPTKTTPVSTSYPYGGAQNVTTPGDNTGTPWEAELVNDILGFQQALLTEATIVPSGSAETALVSQYLDAVRAIAKASAGDTTARQTVLSSTLDASGDAGYLSITGAGTTLTIDATTDPLIATFANGFDGTGNVDDIAVQSSDIVISSGFTGTAGKRYIYLDYVSATSVTAAVSSTRMTERYVFNATPTTGETNHVINEAKSYSYNGSTWDAVKRIEVGQCEVDGAGNITSVMMYPNGKKILHAKIRLTLTDTSLPSGVFVTIPFDTKSNDEYGIFDSSTYSLVVPDDGEYTINSATGIILTAAVTTGTASNIFVNGAGITTCQHRDGGNIWESFLSNTTVHLNAGDVVTIVARTTVNGTAYGVSQAYATYLDIIKAR